MIMQMQRQKINGRKLVVCALVVVFFLSASWSNAATPEAINIAWTGEYWSTLPFRVAADKGFFERENIQARFITFQSTQLITNALMQGDIDYGTTLAIAGAALRGLPLKIVGVVAKGTGYAIVSKPEIDTVKGLKGKKSKLIRQRTRLRGLYIFQQEWVRPEQRCDLPNDWRDFSALCCIGWGHRRRHRGF